MIISNFATFLYLHRHMRKLGKSGISVSASRLRSQLRVTVAGICQSVIFFGCMTFNFIDSLTFKYAGFFFGSHISFTVSNLYVFGTTVNMAVGQSTFRPRVAALCLMVYTFFFYCLILNHYRQVGIKQPLKLLLYSGVCSCTLYLLMLIVMFFFYTHGTSFKVSLAFNILLYINLTTVLTSTVWQSFFYCVKIIPGRRRFFMWIKRNIKSIVYALIFVDRLFCTLEAVASFLYSVKDLQRNRTVHYQQKAPIAQVLWFVVWTLRGYYCVCFLTVLLSCWSTALFLYMHLRRMAARDVISCPRVCNQVRISVTGLLQGVLYIIYASWLSFLYLMGRSLSYIAMGQNVFRQQMADIWLRASRLTSGGPEGIKAVVSSPGTVKAALIEGVSDTSEATKCHFGPMVKATNVELPTHLWLSYGNEQEKAT
uniref:uncharacterized protein LOC131135931 n=1 Tax=Doryrhamphus excisus TaxID=161450 RepID=UPI0025AE33A5|nr:uncharacterized protein LOC131135931 [Doryrhamphus excisus]